MVASRAPPTGSAFLLPKSSSKCRMIANLADQNAADPRRPPRFRLPQMEQLNSFMASVPKGRDIYFCKLDISNAYWSVILPAKWRRAFVLGGGGREGFRYKRLPFGWAYSPVIFQRFMKALCRSALQGAGVHFFVYIDDILLAGTCVPALRRALGLLVRKLEGCGFIISEKSVRVPTRRVKFVGKVLDGRRRCIYNGCQLSACILARLVSAVGEGGVERRKFEALLGKMLWFLRPLQGVGPFLAGAYRAVRGGGDRVSMTANLTRSLVTAFALGHMSAFAEPRGGAPRRWEGWFSDAAPEGKERFRAGVVAVDGVLRSYVCPAWVKSLQAAELWAVYLAVKVAVYRGVGALAVGTDSMVTQAILRRGRAAVRCDGQQRILRRLFWLYRWSGVQVQTFRVPSRSNPADPPSRLPSFPSRAACARRARALLVRWRERRGEVPGLTGVARIFW